MTVFQRISDFVTSLFHSLPTWMQTAIHNAFSAEFKILSSLVDVAVKDIETGGLTSASAVSAAKDIYAQLVAQNISTFNLQYVFSILNAALASSSVATPVVVTTSAPVDTPTA
jgi:hypothetical protein